jgi:hypothetical protein
MHLLCKINWLIAKRRLKRCCGILLNMPDLKNNNWDIMVRLSGKPALQALACKQLFFGVRGKAARVILVCLLI